MTSDAKCDKFETTVGLEEMSLASNVKLYPNPSMGNFNVSFTNLIIKLKLWIFAQLMRRLVKRSTVKTKYALMRIYRMECIWLK